MKELNKNSYLLTRDGFKDSSNIKSTDYVSTLYNGRLEFNKVVYTSKTKMPLSIGEYTYLQTSTSCFSTLLFNKNKVLSISKNEVSPTYKLVSDLKVDDWVFNYWLKEDIKTSLSKIDLSKYCDNFSDLRHLYMFNSSIKDLAKELNIPMIALKELLVREAAEYDEHLEKLKDAIAARYNITETYNTQLSFPNLKNYIKNNFVHKVDRFIEIDKSFISFIASFFLGSRLCKKENNNHSSYIIELSFNYKDERYNQVKEFIKKLKIKSQEIQLSDNSILISIFNKPLYMFLNDHLSKDLSCITHSSLEFRDYFVSLISANKVSFNTSFSVALQFTELFNYYRKVINIDNDTLGVSISIKEDNFDQLGSDLIVEENGYYSKVIGLSNIESDPLLQYTTVVVPDSSGNCTLNTINCTVRSF